MHELARDRSRAGTQRPHPRQALEHDTRVALVARVLKRLALLPRPLQAPERDQPALELGRQLEQVHHVLARVRALLGGEGTRVPAREAGALRDAHSEQLGQQRLVGRLRSQPGEAGRHLRVEHVCHLAREPPAHERDVLAPGVHDDLDVRVRQDRRQRCAGHVPLERIQELDLLGPAGCLRGGELHQAQKCAVAALAHELRVKREPARRARGVGELRQRGVFGLTAHLAAPAHGAAPGSSHSLPPARPAWRDTSVPCARTQRAGDAQAGFSAAPRRRQGEFRNA